MEAVAAKVSVHFYGRGDDTDQVVEVDHVLKTWPDQFQKIHDNLKRHEFRKNDRDFRIWETVLLREFDPVGEVYSNRVILATITAISYGPEWGIPEGYTAFTIREERRASIAAEWSF